MTYEGYLGHVLSVVMYSREYEKRIKTENLFYYVLNAENRKHKKDLEDQKEVRTNEVLEDQKEVGIWWNKMKGIKFIMIFAYIMAFISLLVDVIYGLSFNPTHLFLAIAIMMWIFEIMTKLKITKNSFKRIYYIVDITLLFLLFIVTVSLAIVQYDLVLFVFGVILFCSLVSLTVVNTIFFAIMHPYIYHHEELQKYADKMSEYKKQGYKLKK